MNLVLASLAVYKVLQLIDALLPREVMPWVKILASVVLSYGVCLAVIGTNNLFINGAAVATMSGTVHAVLRLLTLSGDAAHRKSLR